MYGLLLGPGPSGRLKPRLIFQLYLTFISASLNPLH